MRVILWEMYRDAVHSRHRVGPLRESASHRLGRIPLIYKWSSDIRRPCCECVCLCVYLVHFERAVLTADYCSFTSLLSVCFAAATLSHHCGRQVLFGVHCILLGDDQCAVSADLWRELFDDVVLLVSLYRHTANKNLYKRPKRIGMSVHV